MVKKNKNSAALKLQTLHPEVDLGMLSWKIAHFVWILRGCPTLKIFGEGSWKLAVATFLHLLLKPIHHGEVWQG